MQIAADKYTVSLNTDGPQGVTLALDGTVARDFSTANMTVKGNADLAIANQFTTAAQLSGKAALDLVLSGPLAPGSLSGTITSTGAQIVVPSINLKMPDTDLTVKLDPEHKNTPNAILAAGIQATARNVTADGQAWGKLIDGPVVLSGNARLMPGGVIDVAGLSLQNGDLGLRGKAQMTGSMATADLTASIRKLSRFSDLAKMPLKGAASATLSARYGFADRSLNATLDASTTGLDLGPKFAVLGGDLTLGARVQGKAGNYEISNLSLAGSGIKVTAPSVTLGDRIASTLHVEIPSLAPLSGLAKRPLQGSVTADAKIDYTRASGNLTVSAQGTTSNIDIGSGKALALVGGDGRLSADVAMSGGKLTVKQAKYDNGRISVTAGLAPGSSGQTLNLNAALDNLGRLVPQLPGAVRVQGTVGIDNGYALNLDVSGPGGINARIGGNISAGMVPDLTVNGRLPLGVVNGFLPSSIDAQGNTAFNLTLRNKLSLAGLGGTVNVTGGRVSLPSANMALTGMTARATISGGQVQVNASTGFSTGGRATLKGTVGLSGNYPMDLKLALNGVGAVKPPTAKTTLNGTLAITGGALGGGKIAGTINLGRTDVSLAFGSGGGNLIDVTHVGERPAVDRTLQRAGIEKNAGNTSAAAAKAAANGGGGGFALDITINAPNRIFVRGRGLDAELGGKLRITGTTANIVPIGQFNLIRGRLDILTRRLDLTQGSLVLQGTFDPVVKLVASTTAADTAITITTSGNATAPTITLSSSPELPQDQILALLLFGKGIDKISPLQALQVASAVRTLMGNGGEGLQGSIRKKFGLDNLDVTTDNNGNAAVKAGKYISKNVYTDVTVNDKGDAQIDLNLDVTPNIKAKGSVGSNGDTSLGIYFEKDY